MWWLVDPAIMVSSSLGFFGFAWVFFTAWLFRDYEVKAAAVRMLFAGTFATAACMLELVLFEVQQCTAVPSMRGPLTLLESARCWVSCSLRAGSLCGIWRCMPCARSLSWYARTPPLQPKPRLTLAASTCRCFPSTYFAHCCESGVFPIVGRMPCPSPCGVDTCTCLQGGCKVGNAQKPNPAHPHAAMCSGRLAASSPSQQPVQVNPAVKLQSDPPHANTLSLPHTLQTFHGWGTLWDELEWLVSLSRQSCLDGVLSMAPTHTSTTSSGLQSISPLLLSLQPSL